MIKRICDICGKEGADSLYAYDGGYQHDVASGRSEETGMTYDVCAACKLKAYAAACGKVPEAEEAFNRVLAARLGMTWKGK